MQELGPQSKTELGEIMDHFFKERHRGSKKKPKR
jgi:hypothetical protein